MKLKTYLKSNNLKAAEIARLLGVHPSNVGRWLREERMPGKEHMRQIFDLTEGAVTPNDWVGIDEEAAA